MSSLLFVWHQCYLFHSVIVRICLVVDETNTCNKNRFWNFNAKGKRGNWNFSAKGCTTIHVIIAFHIRNGRFTLPITFLLITDREVRALPLRSDDARSGSHGLAD